MKCVVPECESDTRLKTPVSMHTFPKDRDICRQWISSIKRVKQDHDINYRVSRVCSRHFTRDAFNIANGRRTLKPNVIPTVFPRIIRTPMATTSKSAPSSPTNNKTSASPIKNRRKSTHQRRMMDDEISFETDTIRNNTSRLSLGCEDKDNTESEIIVEIDDDEINPNDSLMKKVAFLRVCVNYLMLNLEMEPFDFIEKRRTLQDLMVEYNSNLNKIKEKNCTIATGSSNSSSNKL